MIMTMNTNRSARHDDLAVVVSHDREVRDMVIRALHAEGVGSLVCPGPCGPSAVCLGDRDGGCPFIDVASVVVLDTPTTSDVLEVGTPSWAMVDRYRAAGMHTVVLAAPGDSTVFPDPDVEIVYRPLLEEDVRTAVRHRRRVS
jgi:hypothetical protein